MKVLALFNTMDRPETEALIGLVEQGVKVRVLCNTSSGDFRLLEKADISYQQLSCFSKIDPLAIYKILGELRRERFDIIHAFTSRTLSAALAAWTFVPLSCRPVVISYRGVVGGVSRFDPTSWMSFLHPQLKKIICVSKSVEKSLATAGVSSSKLQTIYKGHDPAWYAEARNIRRELSIGEDAFVVCYVSNMRPGKGAEVVLEAARQLRSDRDIYFLLVGEVKDRVIGKKISDLSSDNVRALGYRSDALSLIKSSDLLLQPSTAGEGLPKTVLEAMFLGVCPVVSEAGGMRELVEHEESGIVVPRGDVQALINAIVNLKENPGKRNLLAERSYARAVEKFSVSQTVQQTLEMYRKVIAKDY